MSELILEGVSVAAGGRRVVEGASLRVRPGEVATILGPNGAGKTSLLRAALGLIAPAAGRVRLAGADPRRLSPAARARLAAYLPQTRPTAWPILVRDAVALGRYAHGAAPSRLAPEDAAAVAEALAACALSALAGRRTDELSGGELARVHVARAFASRAPLIVADEPAAALDPFHRVRVMALFRARADAGAAALVVLHDPALAARFSDRLIWMAGGRVLADGAPKETLTAEMMRRAYGVEAEILTVAGAPAAIVTGA